MSAASSKLPRRLAMVGVAISLALLAVSLYIAKYNPFHLPTTPQQAHKTGSYSEPTLLVCLENMTVILCPGLLLEFFAMDMSAWGQLVIWGVAAAINGVLYYWLGRGIVALLDRVRRRAQ